MPASRSRNRFLDTVDGEMFGPGRRAGKTSPSVSALRRHPVRAALVAGHDVLRAFDVNVDAESCPEQLELATAQVLARLGGGADGAVVLHQQVRVFAVVGPAG